jgi:hypothetical protein
VNDSLRYLQNLFDYDEFVKSKTSTAITKIGINEEYVRKFKQLTVNNSLTICHLNLENRKQGHSKK